MDKTTNLGLTVSTTPLFRAGCTNQQIVIQYMLFLGQQVNLPMGLTGLTAETQAVTVLQVLPSIMHVRRNDSHQRVWTGGKQGAPTVELESAELSLVHCL